MFLKIVKKINRIDSLGIIKNIAVAYIVNQIFYLKNHHKSICNIINKKY